MTHPPIKVENLRRRFGKQLVLNGLDFEVNPGEVYALLGRNGVGKTTAIRILLGFLEAHAGQALVFGRPSREMSPEDRGRLGYVGEGHRLPMTLSALSLFAMEEATRKNFDLREAKAMLGRCGLDGNKRVFFLSRGQRAQLALIIAIASRPEVLILDDPGLGLDTLKRREFLDAMIDFLAERGGTVLFSSHILGDVERVADRVGILDEGALIVDATMSDLKTRIRRRRFIGPLNLPDDDRILRVRKRRDGHDLLLRDEDADLIHRLSLLGTLAEAEALSLEELFIELMSTGESLLPSGKEELQSC